MGAIKGYYYLVSAVFLFSAIPVFAETETESPQDAAPKSYSPYIDQLKEKLKVEPKSSDELEPYISAQKKRLENQEKAQEGEKKAGQSDESFIEKAREANPALKQKPIEGEDYLQSEKAKLPPHEDGGAIQAFKEGRSELVQKKKGIPHNTIGFRYGVSVARNFDGSASGAEANSFNSIYAGKYAPDLSLYYEFSPFHSKLLGNAGIRFMGGLSVFSGVGKFEFAPKNPVGGNYSTSPVNFNFFSIPVVAAAFYRFNLFHYLRPYAALGFSEVVYFETRSDTVAGNRGHSEGIYWALGLSLLMDWISPKESWESYIDYQIHHTYLNVEYSQINTFAGIVNMNTAGITAGFSFEF